MNENQILEALRTSLKDRDRLSQSLRAVEAARTEPIAVVSMGCRYPGGIASSEDLWDVVSNGRDVTGTLPSGRGWDLSGETDLPLRGGFLRDADAFDAGFFNMSPYEAMATDPQHRLLLEVAWETLERACIKPEDLAESSTGVFIGSAYQGYGQDWYEAPSEIQGPLVAGMSTSIMSGRIAYVLGLHGPALTIDTACSSSLTAVHLAVASLRSGECDLAFAGGAAVMTAPISLVGFARQDGVAPDGRCKAFGADADGMGLGEGVGLVLLEKLSRARSEGHPVLAVIRGSAANQDGASNGISAPSGPAQREVIQAALTSSGLIPKQVDAVETHGTGTRLGDPIEGNALLETYGQGRSAEHPLWIGSLKSNIGHSQAAAGVGGLIKSVEALRHSELPASLHCCPPSPFIDWESGGVRPLVTPRPLPEQEEPHRIGVSAFGLSGTNIHMIVEQAPADLGAADEVGKPALGVMLWPLSARSPRALALQAGRLAAWLNSHPEADVRDIAWTLAVARQHHEHRAIIIGEGRDDLLAGLEGLSTGSSTETTLVGRVRPGSNEPVFLFPGQGSQFVGMAKRLYQESPVFAAALRDCGDALTPYVDWDLIDIVLSGSGDWLSRVDVVQPTLWASMVALAQLWRHLGLAPGAVVGHSQGEIAAAAVAGHLSLEDAARVVAQRAQMLRLVSGQGGMVSVRAGEADTREILGALEGDVSIAAHNSPESIVVSGAVASLDQFVDECARRGVEACRINVDYASHSAHMEPLRASLCAELADVRPNDGNIPMYSTVYGRTIEGTSLDGVYWYENLRSPVRLDLAVQAALADGYSRFVECSVHPVLLGVLDGVDAHPPVTVQETLRRNCPGALGMAMAVAGMFVTGSDVDWRVLLGGGHLVRELPTYAFDRQSYWLPSRSRAITRGTIDATLDELIYRVDWVFAPEPIGGVGDSWTLLVPESGVPEGLVNRVRSATGAQPLVIPAGTEADDLVSMLAETDAARIVSLLGVDSRPVHESGRTTGLTLTLALLQVAERLGVSVWHITSGGVAIDGQVPDSGQAAIWGLVRIALAERPGSGGIIDLGPEPGAYEAVRLGAVLGGALPGEDQLLLHGDRLRVRRLARAVLEADGDPRLSGTALVVGGTSGLGAELARWLPSVGATRVVLASRRGNASPGVAELIADIETRGADVEVRACDIADASAVEQLVASIEGLRAVFSTAGVLDDALIGNLTSERLDTVLAAKAAGAINLDRATRDHDLQAFVVFSSMAGTLGGPGQGNYAAANSAVDAVIAARREAGLPGTAIAWGAVAGGGLADEEALRRLAVTGIAPVSKDEAVRVVGALIQDSAAHTVVARVDWAAVAAAGPSSATLSDLVPSQASVAPIGQWSPEALLRLVREQAAEVLGHRDSSELDVERAFRDLGFDSVTVVDLRRRLTQATGVKLSVASMFDHPSASAVALHLARELGVTDDPTTSESAHVGRLRESEPLAVVGMACRLPGDIDSPEGLWRLLDEGGEVVGPMPTNRGWDLSRFSADTSVAGTFNARGGSFLTHPEEFDAEFFGISPREAITMDPQQRLLLEASWEAIESAGIAPAELRGTDTGVFLGASYNDYGSRITAPSAEHEGYLALGSASSVASGRVAYVFGLTGPALTIDTACSSSLAALTVACQSLRDGTCSAALVGGVTVMSTMTTFIEFSRQRAGSEDGRCRAFSAEAAGAGWAEGVGVILIEPLSAALAAGHPVLGTIVGIAMNQDGASNGLTAPSGTAQAAVIRKALEDAGVATSEVQAIEAHGTGTELGDPIEASALTAVYGAQRQAPLWLGSLKSNLGHTQAASGLLSIIKVLLALSHERLPRTLHAEEPSPYIDWDETPLHLLQEPVPWPKNGRRVAGVSSFGISGTNVHVLIGDPPSGALPECEPEEVPPATMPIPVVAAGSTAGSHRARLEQLARLQDDPALHATARTLARHAVGERRSVLLAQDTNDLREAAAAALQGHNDLRLVSGEPGSGGLAWVFSGQGSQRAGMGSGLMHLRAFREAFDETVAVLRHHVSFDLCDAMSTGDMLHHTDRSQAAIFAHEVASARALEAYGVRPRFLVGHSIGEFAALHIAGVLSLEDAARLVAARGHLMAELPEGGIMVAVHAPADRVTKALEAVPDVALAAVNGPTSVVLSGPNDAVTAVVDELTAQGVRTRRLKVSHAFHSPMMAPMRDEFVRIAQTATFHQPELPIISTVTGEPIDAVDADYLGCQVMSSVRFADAVGSLVERGVDTYLEVGPSAVLTSQVSEVVPEEAVVLPLQRGDVDAQHEGFVRALAHLEVRGIRVDWDVWFGPGAWPRRVVPPYPFDHQSFWLDSDRKDVRGIGVLPVSGRMLGARVDLPSGETVFTADLARHDLPWLFDHHVGGEPILPGAAYIELGLEVAQSLGCEGIAELTLSAPLVLDEDHTSLRWVAAPTTAGEFSFSVFTLGVDGWVEHASGVLGRVAPLVDSLANLEAIHTLDHDSLYEQLAESGFDHGASFRGLRQVAQAEGGVVRSVSVLAAGAGSECDYVVHPALLDSALHALAFVELPAFAGATVPFVWRNVTCHPVRGTLVAETRVVGQDRVSVVLRDEAGLKVGCVGELVLRDVGVAKRSRLPLMGPDWVPVEASARVAPAAEISADADIDQQVARLEGLAPLQDDETVVVHMRRPSQVLSVADAALETASNALRLLQAWLGRSDAATLAFVTTGAHGRANGEPAHASVWGLVGSAINEHPGRFRLIDRDRAADDIQLALGCLDEPKLRVVTAGDVRALRIAMLSPDPVETPAEAGTWVISGAGGVVGRTIGVHLVASGVAGRLVLLSRRGPADPVLAQLRDELAETGVRVDVLACDVTQPGPVDAVFEPLGTIQGIVHAAGILDDGVIEQLTSERLAAVLRVKIDGAANLVAAGRRHAAQRIILVSSIAGVLGGAGQGSYAAANSMLDAIARMASDPVTRVQSHEWGLWATISGMTSTITEAGASRIASSGIAPLDAQAAETLFDDALGSGHPVLALTRLARGALRTAQRQGTLLPAFRGLVVPEPGAEATDEPRLVLEVANAVGEERSLIVLRAIRAAAAEVLGYQQPDRLPTDRGLLDVGFDSLTAVELRNRIAALSGLRLPATLLFDHPTVRDIAEFVEAKLPQATSVSASSEPRKVQLQALAQWLRSDTQELSPALEASLWDVAAALQERLEGRETDEELFEWLDNELGEAS